MFYEYNEDRNIAKKYLEIENSGEDAFEDVEVGYNNSHLYIISGNKLFHYTPNYKTAMKHELAGELCTRIYVYMSTLHIFCEYEKRNFIGE